jgi:hypothetical protein
VPTTKTEEAYKKEGVKYEKPPTQLKEEKMAIPMYKS